MMGSIISGLPFTVSPLRFFGALLIAFLAGCVDAIAGGGGLIHLPGMMTLFPNAPMVQLLAINKTSAVCGTFTSFLTYFKEVGIDIKKWLAASLTAFVSSMLGAYTATKIPNTMIRPLVIVMLFFVVLFTIIKKDVGQEERTCAHGPGAQRIFAFFMGAVIGFYDGFLGPGTGNFLIMAMISYYGMDFLHASAAAKMINLSTNIAAVFLYYSQGYGSLALGLSMGFFNLLGARAGVRFAVLKGSRFVRITFILVSIALLLKQIFFA